MRKPSTWTAAKTSSGYDCVVLVSESGRVLTRLSQRFTTLEEAQAEVARRNEKAKR